MPHGGTVRVEREDLFTINPLADVEKLVRQSLEHGPYPQLVAEAGAEFDAIDQVILIGVAEVVEPPGY